ncbi:unnamed protein product, partial [Symbiodinium microadriaticum]
DWSGGCNNQDTAPAAGVTSHAAVRTAAPVEPEPGFVTPAQESTSLLAYCDMDEEGNYKCRLRDTGVMSMLHLQVMTEAHQGRLKWFLKEKKKTAVTAQASSSTAMAPAEGAASKAKSAPKKRVQEEVKMEEEPEPKTVKVDEEPKVESGSGMAAATAKVETEQATATAVEEAAGEVQEQPMQVAKTEEQAMEVDKVPEQPVAKTEEQAMEVDTKVEAMEVDTKVEAAVEAAVEAEVGLEKVKYRVSGVGATTIVVLSRTSAVEPANVEGGKGKKWKLDPPKWLATFVHKAGADYVAGIFGGAFWISLLVAGLCDDGAILLDEKEASAETAATAQIPQSSEFDPGHLEGTLLVGWYKKPSFSERDLEDLAQRIEPPALFVQST